MVSAALRVTETPGSCRIHSDEYGVNEGAGSEDDSDIRKKKNCILSVRTHWTL